MKKAIIVASFGTSYERALKNSIASIENDIREHFRDYEIFRAFTAHRIIEKLKRTTGVTILTPEELLNDLHSKGYDEVIVQPLHLIAGEEFDYLKKVVAHYKNKFSSLKLGRPIFYYEGVEEVTYDYSKFIKTIEPIFKENENVVLVGHGTAHPANASYGCLQSLLQDLGYNNVFVGTIEGYPSFDTVLARLKRNSARKVLLMPLLVVAGDHALNDISSDDEDSWNTRLRNEDIETTALLKGLGEFSEFRKLYINRINDVINNTYKGIGKTKKGKLHENNNNII